MKIDFRQAKKEDLRRCIEIRGLTTDNQFNSNDLAAIGVTEETWAPLIEKTQAQQLALKRVVALWPERVAVFETVVGKRLAEINTGILGRHWGNRLCDQSIKNQPGRQVKC